MITDTFNDDAWKVWPHATEDVDGDGVDEIVLATAPGNGEVKEWVLKISDGKLRSLSCDGGEAK